MADTFNLVGSYTVAPASGISSGCPSIDTPINEPLVLGAKNYQDLVLGVDTPVAVPFGTVVNAHVIVIKAIGGKVRVRLTSADGSLQSVPVDSLLALIALGVPVTAIDLTRTPATSTTVKVFVGEKAA